jgi:hypothetical protein
MEANPMKMKNLRVLFAPLLLLGCAGNAAADKGAQHSEDSPTTQRGLPGLPEATGTLLENGRYEPLPSSLSELLEALRCTPTAASAGQEPYVVRIKTRTATPDYVATDQKGPDYRYWIRSFAGSQEGVTGYLVQLRGCGQNSDGPTGIHAYRVTEGLAPEDITSSIPTPDALLGTKAVKHYLALDASGFFADTSRLAEVPVLRWIMEADPDRGLPGNDPQVFDSGMLLHGGFVVWNGERFESRKTVPASLWPCPAEKPSLCPEDDRFVIRAP